MILVEEFPCKDKYEACKREREVYEELDAKMNTLRPYRTQEDIKEYHKKNDKKYRENHKEKIEQYREDHKEEIKQNSKQYYQDHKEKLNENHKQYYQDHKEKYKQNGKQYREDHKAEMNEKIECDFCNKLLSKNSMYRHIKTCKSKE
jgi:hypothetical protein